MTSFRKRIAIPIFASDALSSTAYATQEMLLVLALGGAAGFAYGPWVALGVIIVFSIVIAGYRVNIRAYPNGAGDDQIVAENMGPRWGLFAAAALIFEYVLTVAVSMSAATANLISIIPALNGYQVIVTIGGIGLLALLNVRGLQQRGTIFALPVYAFLVCVAVLIGIGIVRELLGSQMRAPSAGWEVLPESSLAGLALLILIARSFASGTTAVTGIQAMANGLTEFAEPKARNAIRALIVVGAVSAAMFAGITWLALVTDVRVASRDQDLVGLPAGETQQTVIVQIAHAVLGGNVALVAVVGIFTAAILFVAANSAFTSFPILGSRLARDGALPRQLRQQGDRLAYSNSIVILAIAAAVLVLIFRAQVSSLIQLYLVGVFIAFGLGQLSMVRRRGRLRRNPAGDAASGSFGILINVVGFILAVVVLTVVLASKITQGAWIVLVALALLTIGMRAIQRHYDRVARVLAVAEGEGLALPARVHAIVLVSRIHKPAMRAVSVARATRPTRIEAIAVQVDRTQTQALTREWESRAMPIGLRVLESPYREIARPVIDYVRAARQANPDDVIIVYVPEYVTSAIWQRLLHNRSATRVRAGLRKIPGVLIASVPWQLDETDRIDE